jgi:hypothetical protein
MNAGSAQPFAKEEDMIAPIKQFAHMLTPKDYSALFSLYDPADFDEDVKNYEAHKDPSEPTVSVLYFHAPKILRDMLFSCSPITFGYHMSKYSRETDPGFAGVRLYDLNQSMLTPLWKGVGIYAQVSHSSDTNYIFSSVFPEGKVPEADQQLSEEFSEALSNFAYMGHPDTPSD